jgi:hypothetical protein
LFDGEYLNGIRYDGNGSIKNNGQNIIYELRKGKGFSFEYDTNKEFISFEGEYLNGERNGKGKEYDIEDNLIFEGEYLNGERKN